MATMNEPLETLERVATALDDDDFDTLRSLLEPNCVYDADRDGSVVGPDAIADVFRRNSEWGRSRIQYIKFTHVIDANDLTKILFIDDLEHNGRKIRHVITMHVAFSAHGLVQSLSLEYAPGERGRLHKFFREAGIS